MPRHKKTPPAEKPKIGVPDELEAARETAKQWQEGSYKLARAVDTLRAGLETIAIAEVDNLTHLPVSVSDLHTLAVATLDAYSAITGQNWRKAKLVGPWQGGKGNKPVHESQM